MEREKLIIGFSVLIAGLCSIVYELLISTTSAYFLGDSVRQFSLTIGIYMAAMGGGSYLSKFINRRELAVFIAVELLLGLAGGAAVPLLYLGFDQLSIVGYQVLTLSLTALIGLLTGFEIPLLARIMKTYYPWNANLANVLSLDYLGALLATLLFPFLLLPFFGLFQSSVGTGMVNVALGLIVAGAFAGRLTVRQRRWLFFTGLLSLLAFAGLLLGARSLLSFAESSAFPQRVIYSRQTPYQRLTLTGSQDELRLYINRVIQFSSRDEYRYHESLALLPAAAHGRVRTVCILGGGEGLLAREVLRLPDVARVVIVDLDAEVFRLAREHPRLRALNERALFDPRVEAVTEDAGLFLRFDTARYDLILADLPDPTTESVARLYSTHFFRLVREYPNWAGGATTGPDKDH